MNDKRYTFVLHLTTLFFDIIDQGKLYRSIDISKVCASCSNPHRYFHEELDTPGLSADSVYLVNMEGDIEEIASATDFLRWVDMAIVQNQNAF
jgi:hypothetical protein